MKNLFKHLSILVLFTIYVHAIPITYCNSQCSIVIDEFRGENSDLNCTLPSTNAKMRITALDVFEVDGVTLKTYFGRDETVCHVLEWMNEGAKHFTDVDGLIGSYTAPITLKFKAQWHNSKYGGNYYYGDNSIARATSPLVACIV